MEKPILFSAPMVNAILEGRKTQTRRIIKHHETIEEIRPVMRCIENEYDWGKYIITDALGEDFVFKPKYQAGDTLWVRETFAHTSQLNLHPSDENCGYVYRADGQPWDEYEGWKWKPSIFMPREASRIRLKVKDVRVERLQDISEEDAIAEGIVDTGFGYLPYMKKSNNKVEPTARDAFWSLWAGINGKESWDINPWVWVYNFERVEL